MNIKRYEVIKKIVDIVKVTNPSGIIIDDYSNSLRITFEFQEKDLK